MRVNLSYIYSAFRKKDLSILCSFKRKYAIKFCFWEETYLRYFHPGHFILLDKKGKSHFHIFRWWRARWIVIDTVATLVTETRNCDVTVIRFSFQLITEIRDLHDLINLFVKHRFYGFLFNYFFFDRTIRSTTSCSECYLTIKNAWRNFIYATLAQ